MVSQVQLGSFFSFGGKTVSGSSGGSGIDTESLVTALVDAKLIPVTRLEDQIEINNNKVSALGEFDTLLSAFKEAASILRNPPGVANDADNGFRYRTTNVISNTAVDGTDYVSVTASPGAVLQSYTITEITSIAAAKRQSTGDINIADADTAAVSATPAVGEFGAGTFTLNGQDITLVDGESLNSVAAKFNAVSGTTGVSASIIKIEDGKFQLSFSATNTGLNADFDFNNISVPGTLVDGSGVFANVTVSTTQNAANAVFKFNGASITRQSNTIGDIVDKVTFNIKQDMTAAPTTQLTVSVDADESIIKSGIINFLNTYNDLKIFAAKQAEVGDDGFFTEDAVLSDSGLLRNTMSSISAQLASVVDGITGGDPSRLADIGITFIDQEATEDTPEVRNLLTIDDGKLTSAIASNSDQVRRIFEFDFVSDNINVRVFSRTNALDVSSFSLDVDPNTSKFQATYNDGTGPVTIDLDAEPIVSSGVTTGYSLKGQAGTVLEGLGLIYASTSASVSNITVTQGIADRIFNVVDPVLTNNTGALDIELDALKDTETRFQADIDRINEQVDAFRQQLLDRFARLEQAIANVNTLLASIEANDNARNTFNS